MSSVIRSSGWFIEKSFQRILASIPLNEMNTPVSTNRNRSEYFNQCNNFKFFTGNNSLLLMALLGTIISIAFFNFAGISVTKEMSATTRMVLDSVRYLYFVLNYINFILLTLGSFRCLSRTQPSSPV